MPPRGTPERPSEPRDPREEGELYAGLTRREIFRIARGLGLGIGATAVGGALFQDWEEARPAAETPATTEAAAAAEESTEEAREPIGEEQAPSAPSQRPRRDPKLTPGLGQLNRGEVREKHPVLDGFTKGEKRRENDRVLQLGLAVRTPEGRYRMRYQTADDIEKARRSGELVPVVATEFYELSPNIGNGAAAGVDKTLYRSLRPHTKMLLDRITGAFYAKFGYALMVNSLTRDAKVQGGAGDNASPFSSHMTGCSFDIAYKDLTREEIFWLMDLLERLDLAGEIEAVVELDKSRCFHVMDRHAGPVVSPDAKWVPPPRPKKSLGKRIEERLQPKKKNKNRRGR